MASKDGGKRRRPIVVSRHGRFRFQTGIVTATLLQRGLTMPQAMDLAAALRTGVAGRDEITGEALEGALRELCAQRLGFDLPPEPLPILADHEVIVRGQDGTLPFSRGIITRYLVGAGLAAEEAFSLSSQLERSLSRDGRREVDQRDVDAEIVRILAAQYGEDYARRYRLTGWVREAKHPVILFVGGATGAGKSTTAMDLAFRLGIRLITSTDMIRETMRTVLPPEVVPGLHDHSFRGMVQGAQVLSSPRERVLAGFRQQAAQVAVGIRAVVRRALREGSSMIIEGIHLLPPFSDYLPEDAACHWAGVIFAVPDEAEHRRRFTARGRKAPARDPGAYLEAFQSVRWVHDDLLHLAEECGAVVVPNLEVTQSLRACLDTFSRSLPVDEPTNSVSTLDLEDRAARSRTLVLVLDGLSDEPNPALGGLTPLAAARPLWLRTLAGNGGQGRVRTAFGNHVPETDEGLFALLGGPTRPPKLGRGMVEALGRGVILPRGSVVFRGNLATLGDDGEIHDRRAGRIREGVADLLAGLRDVDLKGGAHGQILPGHEHRVVVVIRGPGLSAAIADTDPGSEALLPRVLKVKATDSKKESLHTAELLDELLTVARKHLRRHPVNAARVAQGLPPADGILVRGATSADALPHEGVERTNCALIASCPTALGTGRLCGFHVATSSRMTGNLDTDIDLKFTAAKALLADHDTVAIHIKGTDVAAHDRRPLEKRDFLLAVDAALGRFLQLWPDEPLRVVVSADHGTSSRTGNHLPDPVPLLLAHWEGPGEQADFTEESAMSGALGLLAPGDLRSLLLAL